MSTYIRMSVCYYQANKKLFSKRVGESYRFIDIKSMAFYINYNKLSDIIKSILADFCNASVIGYERRTNKYWCKTYDDKYCILHIEIEIMNKDNTISIVNFIPLIGTDILIQNFVSNFRESIQLYTTSSFIRSCLDGNLGL